MELSATATTLKRGPGGLLWIAGSACMAAGLIGALIYLARSNGAAPSPRQSDGGIPSAVVVAEQAPPAPGPAPAVLVSATSAPQVARVEITSVAPIVTLKPAVKSAERAAAPRPARVGVAPVRLATAGATKALVRSAAALQVEHVASVRPSASVKPSVSVKPTIGVKPEQQSAPDSDIALLAAVLSHSTRQAEEQAYAEAIRCAGMRAHGKHCVEKVVEKVQATTTVR